MAPPQNVQKWLTLTAHCLATFSNAMGFGIFFINTDLFASYYSIDESLVEETFFIGLLFEILFCLPAMKIIEWRLDYSLMSGAFLSMAGYYMQYVAQDNFYVGRLISNVVICCMCL